MSGLNAYIFDHQSYEIVALETLELRSTKMLSSTQFSDGYVGLPLRANKRETIDWLKFTLDGVGEEPWLPKP